jgi:8-oxo-dGTP pyrophosphatase MutT (NUDIX family)
MSYLDCIKVCNHWNPADFVPFTVAGETLGWIKKDFVKFLAHYADVFEISEQAVSLSASLLAFEARNKALQEVLDDLVSRRLAPPLHGEKYPVGRRRDRPELLIDREAAGLFGVRAYGQHINAFVRDGDQVQMWIGQRSRDKRHFPGKLDHLAAGGLPYGIGMRENVQKECWEEAGMALDISSKARPVGALTYCRQTDKGLKPDTIFCYDLELSRDFRPQCTDGEVEKFYLMDIDDVSKAVRDSEAFKPNCSLVIIDFLIRHGQIDADAPDYLDIVQALHPQLP